MNTPVGLVNMGCIQRIVSVSLLILLVSTSASKLIAQAIPVLGFSALGVGQHNMPWTSRFFSTPLYANCLYVEFGISLYLHKPMPGEFLYGCISKDSSSFPGLILYPNPATSIITLRLKSPNTSLPVNSSIQLRVVDVLGQTMQFLSLKMEELIQGYQLNILTYSNGVYFLMANSATTTQVLKFVKAN